MGGEGKGRGRVCIDIHANTQYAFGALYCSGFCTVHLGKKRKRDFISRGGRPVRKQGKRSV